MSDKKWQWRSAGSVECACGDKYPHDSFGAGFMAANNGVCENCDMTDERPLDRLAQAGLAHAAAKWERGGMDVASPLDGDSGSLSTKRHGNNANLSTSDPVNHPAHYQSDDGIECIDAIRAALGPEGFVAHCRGTAIKYAWRAGSKGNAAECLRKGAWYLTRAAEELEQ